MKKIKLLLIGCILIFTFALGGCMRVETSFVVDEDSSITMNYKYAFNKEKANAALKERTEEDDVEIDPEEFFAEFSEETIHGEQYYVKSESNTYTQEEFQEMEPSALINKDKFYLYITDAGDEYFGDDPVDGEGMGLSPEDIEYVAYSVTLPSPVVKTNGELQEDKHTVIWDYTDAIVQENQEDNLELYAYTANDPADPAADRQTVLAMLNPEVPTDTPVPTNSPAPSPSSTPIAPPDHIIPPFNTPAPSVNPTESPAVSKDTKAPVIKGIKKNKSYKKKVTVYVKDNQQLKKVTVNGKKAKLTKVKKGKYKGYFKFTVKKKGKKTIVAYDAAGNKKKISIKIK